MEGGGVCVCVYTPLKVNKMGEGKVQVILIEVQSWEKMLLKTSRGPGVVA